ncbi:MAG: aminopeptidase P family protein [Myxococcota bacterium]|nr:aminopeptidase P family protein [Myxococcota bacterium]
MPSPAFHADRRKRLQATVSAPVLLVGNGVRARNLPMTHLPFRQDSTFLYFTGCDVPGAALLLASGEETLFLPAPEADDALWHGHVETLEALAERYGIDRVRPAAELESTVARLSTPPLSLPVPDAARTQQLCRLTGAALEFGRIHGDPRLVNAVIRMRRCLGAAELAEMRAAAVVTDAAHRAVMRATKAGRHERHLRALFEGTLTAAGLAAAYDPILTVRGEVLHNFRATNTLADGQLLLLDGGAESAGGYATDVTRTWPVSGTFSPRQRAAYEAVLAAQEACIDMVRPGTRYRAIHDTASLVLSRWLVDEGLLTCSPEAAVESGSHALFFPHGVGHLIGLDVHDLENFGDIPAYPEGRARSDQFGTEYLRLDVDLEAGMVVTIEPGFYVVPAILADRRLTERFSGMVNLDAARAWSGFGGIRIEDDVAVTATGPDVLTAAVPKSVDQLEALVGTGPLTIPVVG